MAAPVNESGTGNESGEPELRPSDLPDTASLKVAGVCDKSPSEGEALVPPRCAGACFYFFMCTHAVFALVGFINVWKPQVKLRRNRRWLVFPQGA